MARAREASDLLKEGRSPSEIAAQMRISVKSVIGYLYTMVGEGEIRRSDIFFSIPAGKRRDIEKCYQCCGQAISRIKSMLDKEGVIIDRDEIELYLKLRDSRVSLGDMYEFICDIEQTLHNKVREVLQDRYADDWWRNGIPVNIRKECASRREEDEEPAKDPYCYTTFINLKDIIDKEWQLFSSVLPKDLMNKRKELMQRLTMLNRIRNQVMHPVKNVEFDEEDFSLVRGFRKQIESCKWKPNK